MPETGLYSLVILAFALFSFVAWQLRSTHRPLGLAWFAGMLMNFTALRLFLGHAETSEGFFDFLDSGLLGAFYVLLTITAYRVLMQAATDDPKPQ